MFSADNLSILWLSIKVALTATLIITAPGVLLAFFLAHWRGRAKVLVEAWLALPLVLPPTAVGIVLLMMLGKRAPLGRLLDTLGIEVVFTWRAAALASAVMAFPLLVRSARTAFEEIDPRLVGIARTLGDSPVRVFFRVVLPLAWRGVLAGTLLSFCRALGEFGATILIAGNIPGQTQTLALAIFQRSQTGRDADALGLAALTALIAFGAVCAGEVWSRRRSITFTT